MQGKRKHLRLALSLVTSLMILLGIASAALLTHRSAVHAAASNQSFKAHTVQIHPITRKLGSLQQARLKRNAAAGVAVQLPCQSNTNPQPILCYGPSQIRQAYGVTHLLNAQITGQGSTIVILDAFGSPTLTQDVHTFDSTWGLPDAPLTILTPFGAANGGSDWQLETTLDVEWAHVMAPAATIDLVVAKSSDDVDISNALRYAVENTSGDVISMSFGENETCLDPILRQTEDQIFAEAQSKGITLLASAGDFGSAQLTCDGSGLQEAVAYPASNPLVTAIGGTALTADAVTGMYSGEAAWNESGVTGSASGGGYSIIYARPHYQSGITGATTQRGMPDLALNASINGGVPVYMTDPFSGTVTATIVGGTSVATPELAGIVADGVQMGHHRLGTLNPDLYRLGMGNRHDALFNDITSGSNILLGNTIPGYPVAQGWDPVTGWGTPTDAETFVHALI